MLVYENNKVILSHSSLLKLSSLFFPEPQCWLCSLFQTWRGFALLFALSSCGLKVRVFTATSSGTWVASPGQFSSPGNNFLSRLVELLKLTIWKILICTSTLQVVRRHLDFSKYLFCNYCFICLLILLGIILYSLILY